MQFTRCPHCDTIFRVTAEALAKAGGRVRCGRCANVFDAHADLREPAEPPAGARPVVAPEAAAPPLAPGAPPATPPDPPAAAAPASAAGPTVPPAPPAAPTAPPSPTGPVAPLPESNAEDRAVAALVAQLHAVGAAVDAADARAAAIAAAEPTITPAEIDEVLAGEGDPTVPSMPALAPPFEGFARRRSSRWWTLGVALALLGLGVQTVHYYRNEIATHARFGAPLQRIYARLGVALKPHWNLAQYRIVDSVATDRTNARGQGSLSIRARINNRGPAAQPYPLLHLRLEDRWEDTVGSRVFAPDEYLASQLPRNRLMAPGETVDAALDVIDPGLDATGFELDYCIEVEANVLSCGADEVFLQ